MKNPKFSILIPYHAQATTLNFAKRQLNYYHCKTTPMIVILAVSGDETVKIELERYIKELDDHRFIFFTKEEQDITNWSSFLNKISAALKTVTTPYVMLNGVDDVVIPEAACEGVELLENNHDVSAVKGYTVCYDCDTGGVIILKGSEIFDNCPIKRIKNSFKDPDSIFYIIRRTDDLINEYDKLINLVEKSSIVRNSPYHIEHFMALSVASLGKVSIMKYPWRLATGHKNNHTSHTEASFLRMELGVLDRHNYEWFQSVNKNMHNISYNRYKFLWVLHQIRGISITFKQIAYHAIYKNCGLLNSAKMSLYLTLHKASKLINKFTAKESFILNNKENFFRPNHYEELKKYYFSAQDIKLIESKVFE